MNDIRISLDHGIKRPESAFGEGPTVKADSEIRGNSIGFYANSAVFTKRLRTVYLNPACRTTATRALLTVKSYIYLAI